MTIDYQVCTDEMVGDNEWIELKSEVLPRKGDEMELDHTKYGGLYEVTRICHWVAPTTESVTEEKEDLEYIVLEPHVFLKRK